MPDTFKVKISSGKRSTYYCKEDLKGMGFYFSNQSNGNPFWIKDITEQEYPTIETFCDKYKLTLSCYKTNRGDKYRDTFFSNNQPTFFHKYYHCVYCGRLLKHERVSVDHLISIKKAQTSQKYRDKLTKNGCETVNDANNLVSSCGHCNSSKGPKGGFWYLRGKIGRNPRFWIINKIIKVVLIVVIFAFVVASEIIK